MFNCVTTGLRKSEKISTTMLVLIAGVRQQPIKTLKAVKKMILDNRRLTIREVADDLGISFGSKQTIFTDVLGMKLAAAKIVPKLQHFEQKHFIDIAQMLTTFNDDPDLPKKVINSDDSWVYGYDMETKVQSSQ